ncbi:hypothetical protein [Pseudomonas aeruginosa]|uniref:hypothetical protein n=1 Tax=Pseudomonas aeruginosa TaxID=287 RepID=UPI0034E0B896
MHPSLMVGHEDALANAEEAVEDAIEENYPDINILDMPPRYLDWGGADPFDLGNSKRMLMSFGIATSEQKDAIFPRRRPATEALSRDAFGEDKCYELWIDSGLIGLCAVSVFGWLAGDVVTLNVKLDAIYLKSKFRKKGLLRPFLEVVGFTVCQELVTYIMREVQAGRSSAEVTVEADLESEGGQASVVILGQEIDISLERASDCTGIPLKLSVIDNAW